MIKGISEQLKCRDVQQYEYYFFFNFIKLYIYSPNTPLHMSHVNRVLNWNGTTFHHKSKKVATSGMKHVLY